MKRKNNIKSFKFNTEFKFEDGKIVTAEKCISIPCKIIDDWVNVVTDVLKSEIPLLLSKESVKKAGTKLDFVNQKVIIFGKRLVCNLHQVVIMPFR